MMRSLIRGGALLGLVVLGACDLVVANPNNPGTAQVKQTPADLENFLGTQYRRWHTGMYGSLSNVWGMANVQSFEDFSSLSNNCMGQRVTFPRGANDNSVGNGCATEQARIYQIESEVARGAADVIRRLDETGFTFGSAAEDSRDRAFAEFLRGLALGYIALVYDSAAVIKADDPLSPEGTAVQGELAGYSEVMAEALVALQKAQDAAEAPATGANGFPLPSTWISSPTSFTAPEFIRLIRSYRARLRATVARTPVERAAVNWDAVIADAQNGITADHINTTSSVTGPFNSWVGQFNVFTTWHQMTPFIMGMADNSGAYASWIALPVTDRGVSGAFFMTTPDQRFPQGATRNAQNADFAISSCSAAGTVCKRYFVNRPAGNDPASSPAWGASNYDFVRFYTWRTSGDAGTGQNGKFPFFTKTELDMLQAEGLYRKGQYAEAAALVNLSRTRQPTATKAGAGLPAITAFDATSPVPGGADCVPKVPIGPSYNTVACGNLFEAIKWEKRMETAYTHFAAWWLDSRGWGDLPEGTGYHWAPPFAELQARLRVGAQIYSTGGVTGNGVAAKGTYGW